jgi:hypothetical protein
MESPTADVEHPLAPALKIVPVAIGIVDADAQGCSTSAVGDSTSGMLSVRQVDAKKEEARCGASF